MTEPGTEETGASPPSASASPTTTDLIDPERSPRHTAAGRGSGPGEGPVQPAADEGVDPSAGSEPYDEGLV